MARGDPTYARIDVDIWYGEKISQLTGNERDTYIYLWTLAVKCRSETIPASMARTKSVTKVLTKVEKTVHRHYDILSDLELIKINADGSITVYKVKELHPRLKWDKDGKSVPIRGKRFSPSRERREESRGKKSFTKDRKSYSSSYRLGDIIPSALRFLKNPFSRKPDSVVDSIIDEVQVSLQIDDGELAALRRLVLKCPDRKRWNELIAACKDFQPDNVMAYLTTCIRGKHG